MAKTPDENIDQKCQCKRALYIPSLCRTRISMENPRNVILLSAIHPKHGPL